MFTLEIWSDSSDRAVMLGRRGFIHNGSAIMIANAEKAEGHAAYLVSPDGNTIVPFVK